MWRRVLFIVSVSSVLVALGGSATVQRASGPATEVVPDRPDVTYQVGETVGWTIRSAPTGSTYRVLAFDKVEIASGTIREEGIPVRVQLKSTEPAMWMLEITSGNQSKRFSAAISPERMRAPEPPEDLRAFWNRKIAEMRAVPANPVYTQNPSVSDGVEYGTIQMDHVSGTKVYGQMARPSKPGKYPAILMLQWAGGPYPLDRNWILWLARKGFLVLNIQPHNVLPTEPSSYYAALPSELKSYTSIRQDDLEKNYFVEMYLRGVRATDYLLTRPDWNGKTLIAMGTSMGGQQAISVAGLHPRITHLIANVAAGCDIAGAAFNRRNGYPFYDVSNPKVREVARYIDAASLAANIQARSLIGIGYIDRVCPPTGIWMAVNAMRGPKTVAAMPDSPHNNEATPAQQKPFTDRQAEWLDELAKG